MKKQLFIWIFIMLGLIGYSCADKNLIRPGDPVNIAFDKAKRVYDKGAYGEAARAFETVISIARGTNYAQDAQYYLAESYFKNKEYLLAASEYQRYMNYYPRDERREEVQYKEALCYYKLSPRYKLDQTETLKALELFQLFILRYPTSEYSTEAGKRVNELRNKLAHKMFDAGLFYLRIREYNAAQIYFGLVVNEYPDSIWADDALAKQMEALELYADNSVQDKKEERYRMALNVYQKYLQLFPNGAQREEMEGRYDDIRDKMKSLAKNS